ncbi:MAG TPA: thioesterase domain-containing protein, partial [Pyrinomonadaceae bacterium]|nr:thioesterase domain-containing protein [Pyrinomonadaceae bacterium]
RQQAAEQGRWHAPRDGYELEVASIFEQVLGVGRVGVEDNFFELGGHSILALRVMARVHKQMGSELELSALMREPTVGGLARLIREQERGRGRVGRLVAIQPAGGREPFYIVHPIGGQVMCYVGLARHLGPEQPVYGLEAGGLEAAAGLQESIEGMAREYVEEVRKVHKGGAYVVGGWSMGGVIAYEMARQMRREGDEVEAVVLIDTLSPAVMSKLGGYEEEDGFLMALYARSQMRARGEAGAGVRPEQFKGMSEREQLEYLKREGVVPEEVSEEYAGRFMEGYRRRQRAIREYQGGGYEGRVVLVRGKRVEGEGDWLAEEYRRMGVDVGARALGWDEEVSGDVEV